MFGIIFRVVGFLVLFAWALGAFGFIDFTICVKSRGQCHAPSTK